MLLLYSDFAILDKLCGIAESGETGRIKWKILYLMKCGSSKHSYHWKIEIYPLNWTGKWKCTSCKIYFFGGQNTMPWLQDSTQRNATIWLSRYQIIIIIQHICKIILDSLLHTTCCNISENCMIAAKCLPSESANLCNHRINVRRCSFGTKGFLFGSGPCQHFHSILVSYLPRNVVISGFLWIWSHPKLLCTKYQHGSRLTVLKLYWLK